MKKIYKEILNLAAPYNDKRDDKGHAETVANFAAKLLETEEGDESIVIPAAILHDIGWSQMIEEERFFIFNNKITKEMEMASNKKVDVRVKHELLGAKLAQELLQKVNFDQNKINKVLDVIIGHDTVISPNTKEDAVMKDADKLWTFTKLGLEADMRRFKYDASTLIDMAEKRIDLENYFHTESAKKIARAELVKLKEEFS